MPFDQAAIDRAATPGKIVIADDDAMQRVFAASVVRRIGFVAVTACDGLEALTMVSESGASILVCDLDMPGLNGHELTRRIRATDLGRYIHIVMLTSAGQEEQRRLALEAGVDDFMTKPLDAAMLTVRIRAAARQITHEHAMSQQNRALLEAQSRIEQDLNVAAEAQRRLLPCPSSVIHGCRFGSAFKASAWVSGDMFGYFPLPGDRLGFYAVAVAGHGVAAALMSVAIGHLVTPQYFASLAAPEGGAADPAQLVQDLNQRFFRADGIDYFTMFCGVLDPTDGRLDFCQAGYPSPILVQASGKANLVGTGGFPVALLTEASFATEQVALAPGAALVLCSDGASEAEDASGAPFGEERLRALVAAQDRIEVETLPIPILSALSDWREGRPLDDDLTVLALARSPAA